MVRKREQFPAECCGVCNFYHAQDNQEGACFALPPQASSDGEGFVWLRGGGVEPNQPACIHFKPRCHG